MCRGGGGVGRRPTGKGDRLVRYGSSKVGCDMLVMAWERQHCPCLDGLPSIAGAFA